MDLSKTMGISDRPINSASEDRLGMAAYAEAMAEFVLSCQAPMTVALHGPCGAGKTSLMKIMAAYICENQGNENSIWKDLSELMSSTESDKQESSEEVSAKIMRDFFDELFEGSGSEINEKIVFLDNLEKLPEKTEEAILFHMRRHGMEKKALFICTAKEKLIDENIKKGNIQLAIKLPLKDYTMEKYIISLMAEMKSPFVISDPADLVAYVRLIELAATDNPRKIKAMANSTALLRGIYEKLILAAGEEFRENSIWQKVVLGLVCFQHISPELYSTLLEEKNFSIRVIEEKVSKIICDNPENTAFVTATLCAWLESFDKAVSSDIQRMKKLFNVTELVYTEAECKPNREAVLAPVVIAPPVVQEAELPVESYEPPLAEEIHETEPEEDTYVEEEIPPVQEEPEEAIEKSQESEETQEPDAPEEELPDTLLQSFDKMLKAADVEVYAKEIGDKIQYRAISNDQLVWEIGDIAQDQSSFCIFMDKDMYRFGEREARMTDIRSLSQLKDKYEGVNCHKEETADEFMFDCESVKTVSKRALFKSVRDLSNVLKSELEMPDSAYITMTFKGEVEQEGVFSDMEYLLPDIFGVAEDMGEFHKYREFKENEVIEEESDYFHFDEE